MTTGSFRLPTTDPRKLTGAARVAYGPLDPAVTLPRPFVMVTGFAMEATSFDRMAEHLATNPENGKPTVFVTGENKFRDGTATGAVLSRAEVKKRKIFTVQYAEPFNGPTDKTPELTQALAALQAVTGARYFDAATHSEGRTDLGLYLEAQQGAPDKLPMIANWVMIGPATRGTLLANIVSAVGLVKNASSAPSELAVGSETTKRVLELWPEHRKRIPGKVTVISMTGVPTLTPGGPLGVKLTWGDGFMPGSEVGLKGAKTVLLEGPHHTLAAHLWEPQYSGVINVVMKTLGK